MSGPVEAPKRQRSGSQKRAKARQIRIVVSDAEAALVEHAAEAAGLTVSSYGRAVLLPAASTQPRRRPVVERAALAQLYGLLGKAGSNVNQIARALNSGGELSADIEATLAELRAAASAIRAALGRPALETAAA